MGKHPGKISEGAPLIRPRVERRRAPSGVTIYFDSGSMSSSKVGSRYTVKSEVSKIPVWRIRRSSNPRCSCAFSFTKFCSVGQLFDVA